MLAWDIGRIVFVLSFIVLCLDKIRRRGMCVVKAQQSVRIGIVDVDGIGAAGELAIQLLVFCHCNAYNEANNVTDGKSSGI